MKHFIINRNMATFLKGIAIILMIIHHSFGFPEWYIDNISYIFLTKYIYFFRVSIYFLIVPMFAFLTGWSYFYHKDKSYKYSLKKIIKFLISYWIVYLLLLFIALSVNSYEINFFKILLSLFGVNGEIMIFSWYVNFYILVMLFLPTYNKFIGKDNFLMDLLIIVSLSIFIKIILKITINNIILANFSTYLPSVMMGYLCAKYNILDIIYNYILYRFKDKSKKISVILTFVLIIIYSIKPVLIINFGAFYVPLFLVCMSILNIYKYKVFNKIIAFLGSQSMNIWFIHCIFFAPLTKQVFQPMAFIFENPILVLIWILIVCSFISIFLSKIQNKMNNALEKFL